MKNLIQEILKIEPMKIPVGMDYFIDFVYGKKQNSVFPKSYYGNLKRTTSSFNKKQKSKYCCDESIYGYGFKTKIFHNLYSEQVFLLQLSSSFIRKNGFNL